MNYIELGWGGVMGSKIMLHPFENEVTGISGVPYLGVFQKHFK